MTHHCRNKEDLPLLTKLRLQPVEAQALHPGLCSHTVFLSPDRSTFDRFEPNPLFFTLVRATFKSVDAVESPTVHKGITAISHEIVQSERFEVRE